MLGDNPSNKVVQLQQQAVEIGTYAQRARPSPLVCVVQGVAGIDGQWRFCPVCGTRNPAMPH